MILLNERCFIIKIINLNYKIKKYKFLIIVRWGLGIGDWGLGIGDWAQTTIPKPQIPKPYSQIKI